MLSLTTPNIKKKTPEIYQSGFNLHAWLHCYILKKGALRRLIFEQAANLHRKKSNQTLGKMFNS